MINPAGNVAVAARDRAQRDKLLITEDPSLTFSIVKEARDQRVPGFTPGGGKMRDPEKEVETNFEKLNITLW